MSSLSVPRHSTSNSTRTLTAATSAGNRWLCYWQIAKPRISLMVLITVTVGYLLGSRGNWQLAPLLHALMGIALVAFASSAFNQWYEQHTDALMYRTQNRPLPSGRLSSWEVLLLGFASCVVGLMQLIYFVNLLTACLCLFTIVLYVGVYTPLKKVGAYCTAIGAIPGALPPVLGWTAAGAQIDLAALSLFSILFLWQFPHFLAIAWLYRDDYARAGLRMLPKGNAQGLLTGLASVIYALVLLPLSLLPSQLALAGPFYFWVAFTLGVLYLLTAIRFALEQNRRRARQLLVMSLLYLPTLLLTLTWNHVQLLN